MCSQEMKVYFLDDINIAFSSAEARNQIHTAPARLNIAISLVSNPLKSV